MTKHPHHLTDKSEDNGWGRRRPSREPCKEERSGSGQGPFTDLWSWNPWGQFCCLTLSGERLLGVDLKWKFKRGPPGFQLSPDYKGRWSLQQSVFDCPPVCQALSQIPGSQRGIKPGPCSHAVETSRKHSTAPQHPWLNQVPGGTSKGDLMGTGIEEAIPIPRGEKAAAFQAEGTA